MSALVASTIVTAGPVRAAEPVHSAQFASRASDAPAVSLPGAVFRGSYRAGTGELRGRFIFPEGQMGLRGYPEVTIGFRLQQPGDSVGRVDPVTHEVTLQTELLLSLLTVDASGSGPVNVAPCDYSLAVELTGTLEAGVVSVADADGLSAAVGLPGRCTWDLTGEDTAYILDPEFAGPGNSISATSTILPAPQPSAPGAPTIIRNATGDDSTALISWNAPPDLGPDVRLQGYLVTAYLGLRPMFSERFDHPETTQRIGQLTNGLVYRFRVQAFYNPDVLSPFSTVTNPVVPTDDGTSLPGAPVIGLAAPGDGSAIVSWSPPASDGRRALTGYVVTPYVGYAPQPSQTFASLATTQILTGLSNTKSYRFRVRAINNLGTGDFSTVTNLVAPTAAE